MLTGITYHGDFPKSNSEIRFEAMRVAGIDFFSGLTFPVGAAHSTLIARGWAGVVVGLSCIDGKNASENETTQYMTFTNGRWYRFRVRVTDQRIAAWIDDQQVIGPAGPRPPALRPPGNGVIETIGGCCLAESIRPARAGLPTFGVIGCTNISCRSQRAKRNKHFANY